MHSNILHYSNLNCAQYKLPFMHYTVTYYRDTPCFRIAKDYPSRSICNASHSRQTSGILRVQLHHYRF